MGANRTSASVGHKRKAKDSEDTEDTHNAEDSESDSEDPEDDNKFKFTPQKPTQAEQMAMVPGSMSELRAVVAAAAAAEGLVLPEPPCAAPIILRHTFRTIELMGPMPHEGTPELGAAAAAAADGLKHAAYNKEERRLSADSCHTHEHPAAAAAACAVSEDP